MRQLNYLTRRQSQGGFGLLEVVIASGILVIFIAGAMGLSRMALKNSLLSSQRTQASLLAQEALELVRQSRDTTWVDGVVNQWYEPLTSVPVPSSPSSSQLSFSQGKWQLISGKEEISLDNKTFRREIFVKGGPIVISYLQGGSGLLNDPKGHPVLLLIQTKVSWEEYGQTWSVDLSTFLSDWKPSY